MEICTNNLNMNLNKCKIKEKEEKWIEQDIIVPDNMPDAIKIINVTALPFVEDVEISEGKAKVVGKVWYYIIYRANEENKIIRGLNSCYPFSCIIEKTSIKSGSNIEAKVNLKNIIYSLPNERKVSIKSELQFILDIKESVSVEVIKDFKDCNDVEFKKCSNTFCNLKEYKRSYIVSSEDVMLSNDAKGICELLKVKYRIKETEYKESYNKLMLKGILELCIVYLSENGSVCNEKIEVPFSGMVELASISEKAQYDICYYIKTLNVKPNIESDSRTLNLEYKIEACISVYENEEAEYVEDFYSRSRDLKVEEKEVEVVTQSNIIKKEIVLQDSLTDIIPENYKIVEYNIDTSGVNISLSENEIKTTGIAKLNLLMQNKENGEVESKVIDLMIDQNFELDEKWMNSNISMNIDSTKISVIQSGNSIDIKLVIYLEIEIQNEATIHSVNKIEDSVIDLKDISSINIYIVKKGDSIWKIAKKYKTSMDNIIKINKLENPDLIDIGQKLLIIR